MKMEVGIPQVGSTNKWKESGMWGEEKGSETELAANWTAPENPGRRNSRKQVRALSSTGEERSGVRTMLQ